MTLRRLGTLLAFIAGVVLVTSLFFQESFGPPTAAETALARSEVTHRQRVPLDRDLWMNSQSSFGWVLGDGFEESEGDGTWIMALESVINFNVKDGHHPVSIELQLVPLVSAVKPLRLFKFATTIDEQTVTVDESDDIFTIRLKLDGRSSQQVRITCDELDSPLFLRIGPDRRPVCAKLLKIRVGSA